MYLALSPFALSRVLPIRRGPRTAACTREEPMVQTHLLGLVVIVSLLSTGLLHPRTAQGKGMEHGVASWYGPAFAGRPTASGVPFAPEDMTAAHRTLPLGTKVMVHNLATGAQTEVKITDRGPYAEPKRRIIDLSQAAAARLDLIDRGIGPVRVTITEPAPAAPATTAAGGYVIQVGAFAAYASAQWLRDQLRDCYEGPYLEARQGPSGVYYRVRLGPFATDRHAAQVATVLKKEGYAVFVDMLPATSRPAPHPSGQVARRES